MLVSSTNFYTDEQNTYFLDTVFFYLFYSGIFDCGFVYFIYNYFFTHFLLRHRCNVDVLVFEIFVIFDLHSCWLRVIVYLLFLRAQPTNADGAPIPDDGFFANTFGRIQQTRQYTRSPSQPD